jgi:hypothetical protein
MKTQLNTLLAAAVAMCLAVPAHAVSHETSAAAKSDQPEQQAKKGKKAKTTKSKKAEAA